MLYACDTKGHGKIHIWQHDRSHFTNRNPVLNACYFKCYILPRNVSVTNMLQLLQSLDYDTCENEPFINEENSRGYSVSLPQLH